MVKTSLYLLYNTSYSISPFTRASYWLHDYLRTGWTVLPPDLDSNSSKLFFQKKIFFFVKQRILSGNSTYRGCKRGLRFEKKKAIWFELTVMVTLKALVKHVSGAVFGSLLSDSCWLLESTTISHLITNGPRPSLHPSFHFSSTDSPCFCVNTFSLFKVMNCHVVPLISIIIK